MASTSYALSLCSSFNAHCKITSSYHLNLHSTSKPLSFANPNSGSLFKIPQRLTFSSSSPLPSFVAKVSEVEAPSVTEPDTPAAESEVIAEASQIVDVSKEEAKRDEIFAVVMVGGRQFIVIPGRFLYVQRLKGANVNDKIALNKVLLVGTKTTTYIGKPIVTNAVVHAVVEEQGLNKKVIVFKYKKKKNYRRTIGHRQPNTRIRITGITGFENYPGATLESSSAASSSTKA
ncbi:50S ribosomal protein L21, chloroplastic [Linum perenne]